MGWNYIPGSFLRGDDEMGKRIVRNAAECLQCGEVIESKHRHDFVTCKCGASSVDGGKSYLRRVGMGMRDLSEFADDDELDAMGRKADYDVAA